MLLKNLLMIIILSFSLSTFAESDEAGNNVVSFNLDDAPFVGGEIKLNNKRYQKSIRLVCVEYLNHNCNKVKIVKFNQGKVLLLNDNVLNVTSTQEIKNKFDKIELIGNVILPTTSTVGGSYCVLIFFPLTLTVDIGLLPVTVPLAFAKKLHAHNALNGLFDLSKKKVTAVRGYNFELLEELMPTILPFE